MSVFYDYEDSCPDYEVEDEEKIYSPVTDFMPNKANVRKQRSLLISVQVSEFDGYLIVSAHLPYFEAEDIDVSLRNEVLSLRALAVLDASFGDPTSIQFANTAIMFERHVFLPQAVIESSLRVTFEQGILKLILQIEAKDEDRARPPNFSKLTL
jgi:HSP20 family molecular chaperone IbpA